MPKYRRRSEVVDAVQWRGDMRPIRELVGADVYEAENAVLVITKWFSHPQRVYLGWWLVKSEEGHKLILPPHDFSETFEPLDPN